MIQGGYSILYRLTTTLLAISVTFVAVILVGNFAVAQDQPLGDLARQLRTEKAKEFHLSQAEAQSEHLTPDSNPVSAQQILAWLIAGVSPNELSFQIAIRGVGFASSPSFEEKLAAASPDASLVNEIRGARRPNGAELPSNYEVLADAALAFRKQNYHLASKIVIDALRTDSNNADLFFALGNLLRQEGRWAAMLQAATNAVKLDPGFAPIHGQLSYALYRLEDPRCEEEARKMFELEPNSAEAHKLLGLAMFLQGNSPAALAEYAKSLEIQPGNAIVYFDIGLVRRKMGDFDRAIAAYRRAIDLDDTNPDYELNLGVAYDKSGRIDDAVAVYRKAIVQFPNRLDLRQNLGGTLCNIGRYGEAIPVLRELLNIDPSWNMARPCLYKALMNTGQIAEASAVRAEYLNQRTSGNSQ